MTDDKTSIPCAIVGHSLCSYLGCNVCHVCGYVSRLVGPRLGRWGAPDASDLMPDERLLALLVDAANAIYAAGRKAERERCAKIADGYFHARGRVVAKAIRGGQDAK